MDDLKYLKLLSKEFNTIEKTISEIVKLKAISVLPKGTEYFLSDLHGEYTSFIRILRSASGNTRQKISQEFKYEMTEDQMNELSNLIYEPSNFLTLMTKSGDFTDSWVRKTIFNLIKLLKVVTSKYSRRKVRNKIPEAYRDLIDEMLHIDYVEINKQDYFDTLIDTIIEINASKEIITTLCHLIQNVSVDCLHIVGDIFDRGPRPDIIMDVLMDHHDIDIQWGNHDIIWMGAALGNRALVANVVRIALGYNNFDSLEDGYGINLRPLYSFAMDVYKDDPCDRFMPRIVDENKYYSVNKYATAKMHKAISIIQFKLACQILKRNPQYNMDHRITLENIDFDKNVYIPEDGKEYPLLDTNFPTIDRDNPIELTDREHEVIESLNTSFRHSEKMQTHLKFLFDKGSVYKVTNSNLLFHGCIPMNEDGSFKTLVYDGVEYSGKSLMDFFDEKARETAYLPRSLNSKERQKVLDLFWYMWCGPISPLFGKHKMSTFENFFIGRDLPISKEVSDPYFKLSKKEEFVDKIFEEFNLNPKTSHVINGHIPVKLKDGQQPISANGKMYVIDGGISKAYQPKTGIAGYTLMFNSHYLALAEHSNYEVMESVHGAYTPKLHITERFPERLLVKDTDEGKEIEKRIKELTDLFEAYKQGIIKERTK
ncbi:fructose-1,6-bisphosphatase [Miniphocaeibacter halophilus]|uniref:Fructose-1,6-bisphosphatase n=1 Tax=Miniphocaeibacter halophilus TaxID=2931922 RepID=A0AC61MS10_9FIRM|nr:fructose-1,6-bisphosphatase [Miniphocaeibacter halophilus]QQK08352.1 fructose-1,6-bisphosphatase [Miniphocaeibacter halophilus]